MNQPWVYMCSPSGTPSPSLPSGSSQCTSPECPVSCIKPGLEIYFTYGNIHVRVKIQFLIRELRSCKPCSQKKKKKKRLEKQNQMPRVYTKKLWSSCDPRICNLPSVMHEAKVRNPVLRVMFENGGAEFSTRMFFSLLCPPLLLYKKVRTSFLLPSPEL